MVMFGTTVAGVSKRVRRGGKVIGMLESMADPKCKAHFSEGREVLVGRKSRREGGDER